jgi:hypothetical protein
MSSIHVYAADSTFRHATKHLCCTPRGAPHVKKRIFVHVVVLVDTKCYIKLRGEFFCLGIATSAWDSDICIEKLLFWELKTTSPAAVSSGRLNGPVRRIQRLLYDRYLPSIRRPTPSAGQKGKCLKSGDRSRARDQSL